MQKRDFVAALVVMPPLSIGEWLQLYIARLTKVVANQM